MKFIENVKRSVAARFQIASCKTSLGGECWAGVTNFLVMSYLIVLVPTLLENPEAGKAEIGVATCVMSAALCVVMGLVANRPFALAPGLGIATIVSFQLLSPDSSFGMEWEHAMGAIVIEGVIAVALVSMGLHVELAKAIPRSLKAAITIGIGVFLMKLGLTRGGVLSDATMAKFDVGIVLTLSGFMVTFILFVSRWKNAALPTGIVFTTVLAHLLKAGPEDPQIGLSSSEFFASSLPGVTGVLACLDGTVAPMTISVVVLSLLLTDTFDSLGTSYTLTRMMGEVGEDDEVPKLREILLVDSVGAIAGGAAGTSSVTTYVESAAGIESGGRTGLTAVVTGLLFLVALFVAPIVGLVPDQATAPALIFIGFIMAGALREIDLGSYEEGIPALMIIIIMAVTKSITDGIGIGFIVYTIICAFQALWGRSRAPHSLLWLSSGFFLVHFWAALSGGDS